jgi:hypothetical protein
VLSSLASLSNCRHRASYLRLLLTHTLPALMGALDAALGDTQGQPPHPSPPHKYMPSTDILSSSVARVSRI